MMSIWPFLFAGSYIVFRLFIQCLLSLYLARSKSKKIWEETLKEWPGISMLLPIRGPVEDLCESLATLLGQSYPGPLELVIAIRSEADPAVADSRQLVAAFHKKNAKVDVRWTIGGKAQGLNPKNSNLAQAFKEARYPWIYCTDADTRVTLSHLKEMATLCKNDSMNFCTAISIHEGPRNLGACLETFGTNLEALTFFLIDSLSGAPRVINGAANFFHRDLLQKVGGFDGILDALTDDLLLGARFSRAGARSHLARNFVRVTQTSQSLKGYFSRYVRWLMIARYFRPDLYFLAPFYWSGQWLLLLGALLSRTDFILCGSAVLMFRVFEMAWITLQIQCPLRDLALVPLLLVYDLMTPILWLFAAFRKQVVWGGVKMRVSQGGFLVE
jgi:ceramide glucosyltransferase